MKKISFIAALLILASSIEARENPFMPTATYQNEMQRMMEIEIDPSPEFQEKKDSEYEYSTKEAMKPKPVAKTPAQIKAELEARKKMKMQAKKEKELAMKMKALEKAKAEAKENPLIFVKMREDVEVDKRIDILPFLSIEYTNTQLKIHSEHKVFKKFYLEKENKLILDFRAKANFYTKHYDLEGKAFSKFSVGNHKEKRFFRTVIKLKDKSENYTVSYDQNMVLITFNN